MNQDLLRRAVQAGLLPAGATWPEQGEARPWPVLLLTALGAWLVALPLLVATGLMLGELLARRGGATVVGALVLAGATAVLRTPRLGLFAEQLATPLLLVACALLGYGVEGVLGLGATCALLALLALGVAALLPRAGLRLLLGAAAAGLAVVAVVESSAALSGRPALLWLALHAALAMAAVAAAVQAHTAGQARLAALLESVGTGWVLATLVGLAAWAGMSFMVGASLGGGLGWAPGGREPGASMVGLRQAGSAALALAAMAWAARQWPALRSPWHAAVAVVPVALAWAMPTLGAVLLVLAFAATSSRWRLAQVAAVAAAWTVGAFYYQLAWPLAHKALLLVAAGALLGGLGWQALRRATATAAAAAATASVAPPTRGTAKRQRGLMAASMLAALAVANGGIWQKEQLIAQGQPVFVELAPADPRSLMQGDYMTLNFSLPPQVQPLPLTGPSPHVVLARDTRGVAKALRLHQGEPLAANELLLALTPKNGRWTVVTDAWFFKEGEAQRWQAARYGEFRVDASGQALLVGLRGEGLAGL